MTFSSHSGSETHNLIYGKNIFLMISVWNVTQLLLKAVATQNMIFHPGRERILTEREAFVTEKLAR